MAHCDIRLISMERHIQYVRQVCPANFPSAKHLLLQ